MPRAPQGFHLLTAETEAIGGGFGRGKGRTDNPGKIPPCVSRWGRGSDTATYRSCSSTSSTLLEEYDPNWFSMVAVVIIGFEETVSLVMPLLEIVLFLVGLLALTWLLLRSIIP